MPCCIARMNYKVIINFAISPEFPTKQRDLNIVLFWKII